MPGREEIALNYSAVLAHHAPADNTAAIATKAAQQNARHKVDTLIVSMDGDPATALVCEFRVNGVAVFTFLIPAAACAPIVIPLGRNGYLAPVNQAVELRVPAPGAAIQVTATMLGQTVSP